MIINPDSYLAAAPAFVSTQIVVNARRGRNEAKAIRTCGQRKRFWKCETVVVAGATGGVGRLVVERLLRRSRSDVRNGGHGGPSPVAENEAKREVTKRLEDSFDVTEVRALVRDVRRAKKVFAAGDDRLQIVGLGGNVGQSVTNGRAELRKVLSDALAGAAAMVICTGTTAFPTLAWRGGNTPKAVDDEFVRELVNSVDEKSMRRVVLVSSIGTSIERRRSFPFAILNAFGILYSKAQGERHVKQAAERSGFAYGILRTGRLLGEPHTNIGMLRFEADLSKTDISVARGDVLRGDLSRSAAADAAVHMTTWDPGYNFEFSVIHADGRWPGDDRWQEVLRSVEMPRQY